ncbi:hypothetical protein L1887_30358 [Cichorium endivia]|nr:hypothetical protein L1887_30358 [Cichorium endivia]
MAGSQSEKTGGGETENGRKTSKEAKIIRSRTRGKSEENAFVPIGTIRLPICTKGSLFLLSIGSCLDRFFSCGPCFRFYVLLPQIQLQPFAIVCFISRKIEVEDFSELLTLAIFQTVQLTIAADRTINKPPLVHMRYGNMALFYHGLNQSELALRHMSRACFY